MDKTMQHMSSVSATFFRSDTPTCLLNIYFPHAFTNVTTMNYNIRMGCFRSS